MYTRVMKKVLIFFFFLFLGMVVAQEQESDEGEDAEIAKIRREYEKKIEVLSDFYYRYLNERIEQERSRLKSEKNEATINAWQKLLIQIEELEREKNYSKILSVINLFDDHSIGLIKEDKIRLKTYFSALMKKENINYERTRKKEIEILLEDFLRSSAELAVASKFVEMREIFLQLISENPNYEANKTLLEISRAVNVLLASRNLAFVVLIKSVGHKMRIRGIEVKIESFDGETLVVDDVQRGKKTYLFKEFHLNDFLTMMGLKSYDGEFLFQTGVKYYLEGQYKKAQEILLLAQKKGVNCRSYLFATEAKLGEIQRGDLLEAETLIEQKKTREAELIINRMLKEKPEDLDANCMLAELRVSQNRISEAYGIYEELIKTYKEHEGILRKLSELGRKLKLNDSYQWSEKLLAINPDDKEHNIIVCKEFKKQEKFDKYLEKALYVQKQNANSLEVNLILADAYGANTKWDESLVLYKKILLEKPTQWDAQQGVGKCLYQQKKYKEAQEYYENLLVQLKSEKKKEVMRKRLKELLNRN